MAPPRKTTTPAKRALKAVPPPPEPEAEAPKTKAKKPTTPYVTGRKQMHVPGGPGINRQHNDRMKVQNCGPDLPPGTYFEHLPRPEEVPPKPTSSPDMERPNTGRAHVDGHGEWQLHTDFSEEGQALHREWRLRWVPSDARRCQARSIGRTSEWQGNRCVMYSIKGGKVCLRHGGAIPNVKKAAQRALAVAALPAAEQLIHIAITKRGVSDADRIKAIIQILDRAGVEGRSTVEIEVKPWQQVLEGIYSETTGGKVGDEETEDVDYELMHEDELGDDDDG